MATTETTTISWGSRLGGSIKGVLVGLALFVIAFPLLFWNEGNVVRTKTALSEGLGACVPLDSVSRVDSEMDGRLVHGSGFADTKDVLSDPEFGISMVAIRLVRKVEMFQWEEDSQTTEKKKLGGSVEKTTSYSYRQVWSDRLIDSSSFHETGHVNPIGMDFQSADQSASNVSLGAYVLNEDLIRRIGKMTNFTFPTNYVCPIARTKVSGGMVYVPNAETRNNPLNNRDVVAQPRVGDMRITFRVVLPHEVSVIAKQRGNGFVSYTAKNGKKILLLSDGVRDMSEMFASAERSSTLMCWILRAVGFFLMYLGLSMVLRPLSVLADVLPFLGTIVEMGTSFLAGVIALCCSLVTIAIAWVFYRPLVAVALLAVVVVVLWRVKQRKEIASGSGNSSNERKEI